MNVRRIKLVGVYGHAHSVVELPDEGVVVVTGDNGSGKSGLFLEGVALSVFGKTLRGAPGWGPDSAGESSASLDCAGLTVERLRKGGKTTLHWKALEDDTEEGAVYGAIARLGGQVPGDGDVFETTTKAQDALERLVGPFDVWRRTSAFSSSDAAHFSLATDAERKRLLESVLGIERFDEALERCRRDIKAEDAKARSLEVSLAEARTRVEAHKAQQARADAEAERFAATAPEPLPEPVLKFPAGRTSGELNTLAAAADAEARGLALRLSKLDEAAGAAQGEARRAKELAARVVTATDCPHCRQPVTPAHRDALVRLAAEASAKAEREVAAVAAERDQLRAEHTEADDEKHALGKQHSLAQAAEAQHRVAEAQWRAREQERGRWAAQRATLEDARKKTGELLAAVEAALSKAEDALAGVDVELGTLRAVETVVGLRGVRAQLLGRALGGVEAVANSWLGRLGLPGLQVTLKPYAEKKTGGVTEAISLDVAGAGAGHGYKGASAGERRRIDVALLLGLAEVAGAARGVRPGTLFFDEVADALDGEGIDAVAAAIEDLAQDRCVVMITHNQELAGALNARVRYHVEGGVVRVA